MNQITLEDTLAALQHMRYEVDVPADIRVRAKRRDRPDALLPLSRAEHARSGASRAASTSQGAPAPAREAPIAHPGGKRALWPETG